MNTGYWFLDEGAVNDKQWQPPADVVDFIDTARNLGKKIVYIGFGSIVVSDPKSMTRCVVEAIMESGVHAILSKGWSDRLQVKIAAEAELEEPLPKEILSISSIPHDWLFQRIDAACHHGGAGTTGASLRGANFPRPSFPLFQSTLLLLFCKLGYLPLSNLFSATNSFGQIELKPWVLVLVSASSRSNI
jgi:sterol 3beta-glucosyltransferase